MNELHPEHVGYSRNVWRYMDYESLVWTIKTGKLHLHRADCFDDPLEGSVPNALKDLSIKTYEEIVSNAPGDDYDESENDPEKMMKAYTKDIRRATFLNCWHLNRGESSAMWDLYGKSNKSLAIKSTVGDLISSITEPVGGDTFAGPVFYTDYDLAFDELDQESINALRMVFAMDRYPQMADFFQIKERSFRHEREFRIIYHAINVIGESEGSDTGIADELPFDTEEGGSFASGIVPASEGFNVEVDVDKLVDEIHMAPQAASTVQESLAGVLDDDDSIPISSNRLVETTIPGDPNFDPGPYQFERLVNARPDPTDEIRQMHELMEEGILTEEEFESKKQELLDRI